MPPISALTKLRAILAAGRPAVKYLAPQENALEIARMNAVRILGLPEANTVADRARAMGYLERAYHGSPNPNVEAFDPSYSGANTGNVFDDYIFATSDPAAASGYSVQRELRAMLDAEGTLPAGTISKGATVYPLMVRTADYLPHDAGGAGWMRSNRPAIEKAQDAGASGAIIRNVQDNPSATLKGRVSDVYATDRPQTFRSRFAAFDPARAEESGLMYARGGLAQLKECSCDKR